MIQRPWFIIYYVSCILLCSPKNEESSKVKGPLSSHVKFCHWDWFRKWETRNLTGSFLLPFVGALLVFSPVLGYTSDTLDCQVCRLDPCIPYPIFMTSYNMTKGQVWTGYSGYVSHLEWERLIKGKLGDIPRFLGDLIFRDTDTCDC